MDFFESLQKIIMRMLRKNAHKFIASVRNVVNEDGLNVEDRPHGTTLLRFTYDPWDRRSS